MDNSLPLISLRNVTKAYESAESTSESLLRAIRRKIVGKLKLKSDLSQAYSPGAFVAINNINLDIVRGETVGIIGRNGSGKSTLLKVMTGVTEPTIGTVNRRGKVASLLELGSGFNTEFTGVDNAILNAQLLGLSRKQAMDRLPAIIEFADIGDFINKPVKTYSSGMFMRLAFAVVAHVDAEILIVDEALAVGDFVFVQKCMRYFREFKSKNTLVFVSHDMGAVAGLSDRVVWLDKGSIRACGSPRLIVDSYLSADFGQYSSSVMQNTHTEHSSDQATASMDDSVVHATGVSVLRHHPEIDHQADFRLPFIQRTTLRNDIEVCTFTQPALGQGNGHGRITDVKLKHLEIANPDTTIIGGELVGVSIKVDFQHDVDNVLVGFMVRDRLGQNLFGDNTYLAQRSDPLKVKAGTKLTTIFEFRMPILPGGEFAVSAAVVSGTQFNYTVLDWINEALILNSIATSFTTGLVGIPMRSIRQHIEFNGAIISKDLRPDYRSDPRES